LVSAKWANAAPSFKPVKCCPNRFRLAEAGLFPLGSPIAGLEHFSQPRIELLSIHRHVLLSSQKVANKT
jgi:hypothetical protein